MSTEEKRRVWQGLVGAALAGTVIQGVSMEFDALRLPLLLLMFVIIYCVHWWVTK